MCVARREGVGGRRRRPSVGVEVWRLGVVWELGVEVLVAVYYGVDVW